MSSQPANLDGPADRAVSGAAMAALFESMWPWPLRLASWATAARRGSVSLDDAALQVGFISALDLGPLIVGSQCVLGLLAEPGQPPQIPLQADTVAAAMAAGGLALAVGSRTTVLVRTPADVLAPTDIGPSLIPPADSLGTVERNLLAAVGEATELISSLALTRPDDGAAETLRLLPRLLDAAPMPPDSSGRARVLRDRAAVLIVGVDQALQPHLAAVSSGLDAQRRGVLLRARAAGRAALAAAANEAGYRQLP